MTTQVSTSHTVNTRAPLKVPKRVPMNHVTLGIQKFLPYAVVFLLSLMLYSALHPKQTSYPPYSPPNMGEEPFTDTYGELGDFARTVMNKRAEVFEDVMRRSDASSDPKTGEWKEWSSQQANTLQQKLQRAKGQEEQVEKATEVMLEMKQKAGETLKSVGSDIKDSAMDVADWWKAYGEELMESANKAGSEKLADTQQFAYDAMYAWKQKSASMKEAAKDKLEDVKSAGEDFLESSKLKVEGVVEKASEGLQDISHDTFRTAQKVVEKVAGAVGKDSINAAQEKLSDVKDAASDMLSSASQKIQDVVEGVKEGLSQSGLPQLSPPLSNRVGSFVHGLVEDEEARRALSMKDEWAPVEFEQKVESIVQQVCLLGGDVADEVCRKVEQERNQGKCT